MSRSGFSIVELLLAVAILGVGLNCMVTTIGASSALLQNQKISWARTRVVNTLSNVVGMAATVRATAFSEKEDSELNKCLGPGGEKCPHNGAFKPIRLYYPFIERTGEYEVFTSGAVTGTNEMPIRYNMRGQFCDTFSSPCPMDKWPIEAFTEFRAICPPLFDSSYDQDLRGGQPFRGPIYPDGLKIPPECNEARFIKIRLTVQPSELRPSTAAFDIKANGANFPRFTKVFVVDVAKVLPAAP